MGNLNFTCNNKYMYYKGYYQYSFKYTVIVLYCDLLPTYWNIHWNLSIGLVEDKQQNVLQEMFLPNKYYFINLVL